MISPYDSSCPSRPVLARKRTSDKVPAEQGPIDADSPDSEGGKSKTRARINMACIHCRHRKIKCDGAQPSCATCVRLRRECEYEPVTEYENLVSRERKRRNKEKKAARMASLGIFAGQSPLSMLHPGAAMGMPSAPNAYHGDYSQQNLTPLFLSMPDPRLEGQLVESQFGPRRRRGISDTQASVMQHRLGPLTSPLPESTYQQASVSQPPTPAQHYRYYQALAISPVSHNMMPSMDYFTAPASAPLMPPSHSSPFFAVAQPSTPGLSSQSQTQQQQLTASPLVVDLLGLASSVPTPVLPSGRASATEADCNVGYVDLAGVPTAVPTSAHVRPVDLPAPNGHFDFASIPFPTQQTFASEVPFASLRRRSSIHLPVGTGDAFRRPSIAEVATAALMQKVAGKRAEKVNTDAKQLADELLAADITGIAAWNAHVQSQMPASMNSWSGFQSTEWHNVDTTEHIPNTMPVSRSNSDGLLSIGPLSSAGMVKLEHGIEGTSSCSVSSSTGDSSVPAEVPVLESSYFQGKASRDISPFALSPSGSSQPSTLIPQEAWSSNMPLLSPVTDLNHSFSSFSVLPPQHHQPQGVKNEDDFNANSLSMAFGHNSTF